MPLTPEDTIAEETETESGNAPTQLLGQAGSYVKERPWLALLVAAGVGIIVAKTLF